MGRLQDKVALVTGAGSGIGRASAGLFAAEGARVVAFDRSEAVHETVEAIRAAGGQAEGMTGDAGLEDDVAGAVARAVGWMSATPTLASAASAPLATLRCST
jgi:NAD(P)-dependent dehydrogenase (short-subunit alcohol dehydrogenase family)